LVAKRDKRKEKKEKGQTTKDNKQQERRGRIKTNLQSTKYKRQSTKNFL
jgi:hypothetical protein